MNNKNPLFIPNEPSTHHNPKEKGIFMSKNLRWQAANALKSRLAIGKSHYLGKLDGTSNDSIYSWKTYNSYKQQAIYFVTWAETTHGSRTLAQAHDHIDEYIELHRHSGAIPWSAWTQQLARCAIAKMYGEQSTQYAKCDARRKENIVRSRSKAVRDKFFSEENNKEFVEFCKGTGLRRTEIINLRNLGDDRISERDGKYFLRVDKRNHTKGGRSRELEIVGPYAEDIVKRIRSTAPNKKVWERVPQCDIHDYRAEYAGRLYNALARNANEIPPKERYIGRVASCGNVYDKHALEIVSRYLGHGKATVPRYDVIVGNYDRYFEKEKLRIIPPQRDAK